MNLCKPLLLLAVNLIAFVPTEVTAKSRVLFPFDFVKFNCRRTSMEERTLRDTCTWTFMGQQETLINKTGECIKVSNIGNATRGYLELFEGYVEVPENAVAVACTETDGSFDEPLNITVQQVRLASPISSYKDSLMSPTIVLQRFAHDYTTRFGTHDVTNQDITINGEEIDSMKLLCIHSEKIEWTNVTTVKHRILAELSERDKMWLQPKSPKLESKWKAYLDLLWRIEKDSTRALEFPLINKQVVYTLPLTIRNVTDATSRKYECKSLNDDAPLSSYVSLRVEDPKMIGPDEIQMIQQITAILDDLAKGKERGNGPYYTLASLLSIILVMFIYYCKLKLKQQQQSYQPPHQCPPYESKPPEEVELRVKRKSSPRPQAEQPKSSGSEEQQSSPANQNV